MAKGINRLGYAREVEHVGRPRCDHIGRWRVPIKPALDAIKPSSPVGFWGSEVAVVEPYAMALNAKRLPVCHSPWTGVQLSQRKVRRGRRGTARSGGRDGGGTKSVPVRVA